MLCLEKAIVLSEHHKALVSQGKRTDLLNEIETMLKLMTQGMRALLAYSAKG